MYATKYTVLVQFCLKNQFAFTLKKIKTWTKIEQLDLAIAEVTQTGNPLVLGNLIMPNLFCKSSLKVFFDEIEKMHLIKKVYFILNAYNLGSYTKEDNTMVFADSA